MIVTNSKHSADNVAQYLRRKEDIVPIYLGSSLFSLTDEHPVDKAAPIMNKYFVYYGGYDFNKNIAGIMLAFGTFIRTYPELNSIQLVFVGGHNKKEMLLAMAKEEGISENVILTPTLSDEELIHYLSHSQGLFRLSFAEGFGLPELEALSLGVPVISSNYGPIKELFAEYAMLHDPKDTIGVVKSLAFLARRKSGTNDMDTAIEYARSFTWEQTTKTLLETIVEYVHSHIPGEKRSDSKLQK
jgi:glycosyltransferase involved in cell wall biosynthesis